MARRPDPQPDRRGNAAVTALALLPLMGFAALAVDVGVLQYAKTEMQVGVDAAALAGSAYLKGTAEGMVRAREVATMVAAQNEVLNEPIQLADSDIVLGYYDADTESFKQSDDPKLVNAIYVEYDATDIPTVFAGAAFGRLFMDTKATAIARYVLRPGVGKLPCFLPFAVPDCYLTRENIQDYELRFSSANDDNAGWATVREDSSASNIVDQLAGTCGTGEIDTEVDVVNLNNGQINTGLKTVDQMLEASTDPWDATRWGALPPQMNGTNNPDGSSSTVHNYGYVIEGPVILFSPRDGTCGSATQFNQSAVITGFAWAVVYDVDATSTAKNIRIKLDTSYDYVVDSNIGGGVESNVHYRDLNLVY